jgi:hypothetical protein
MRRSIPSVRSTAASPLEEVDAAFLELAAGPWPVRLPAHLLTDRPDAQDLPVDQVRARLAHPSTPAEVRTRSEVVRRSRDLGGVPISFWLFSVHSGGRWGSPRSLVRVSLPVRVHGRSASW